MLCRVGPAPLGIVRLNGVEIVGVITSVLLPTLKGYRWSWVRPDLIAGMTLAAVAIPEQIATAGLANMPAVAGMFAFVFGSLGFALLGRSPQVSVGADSTIAPIVAAGVAAIAVVGTSQYSGLVFVLALMVGGLLLAVGLLRAGWIADFLSAPVIIGLLAGIGIQIFIRQVPAVLGISGSDGTLIERAAGIAQQVHQINWWSVAIAGCVLTIVFAAGMVSRRIPAALIGVVLTTAAVGLLDLTSKGVSVVGAVDAGMPTFEIPAATWANLEALLAPALTIAFICIAQTAATVRGQRGRPPGLGDFNRDLIALSVGNIAAGVGGSFAVNASPPRTEIVASSGGKSQVSGILAAAATLAVALWATGLLADLPEATLGAILIFIATRLIKIQELRTILHFDSLEFVLAVITLLSVAVFGIEGGVVAAIVLSLADRTRRAAWPRDVVLGREPGTDHWIAPDVGITTEQLPGITVYLIYAPLWYGNAEHVRLRIQQIVDSAQPPTRVFVLDANGISDIDYTGTRALAELITELRARGVHTAIARSSHLVHHDLKHGGLLQVLGQKRLYSSVQEAVDDLTNDGYAG